MAMSPDSSNVAVSDAILDWYNAWENGDDLAPASLRPEWQPCQLAELGQEIERRKALLRCCDHFELLLPTTSHDSVVRPSEIPNVPGYRNLRVIGKGGQGVVYK